MLQSTLSMLQNKRRIHSILHSVLRAIFFTLLWLVLVEGDWRGWWFGVPAIILATLVSRALLPDSAWTWRLRGMVRFIGFFLWQSLRGGTDVALRALNPRLPLSPTLLDHPLRLSEGLAQYVLLSTISLLPGTLIVDLHAQRLQIHVLDANLRAEQSLQRLEAIVADMFGIDLPPENEDLHA